MADLSVNKPNTQQDLKQDAPAANAVETGGVIASASNTPSPLFSAVPSVETGGSIASSAPSSSSSASSGGVSSGGVSYTC